MKANVGTNDKLIRFAVAIVLVVLFYKHILTGTIGVVALIVALVLTLTGIFSFCPLYPLFGINSCKKEIPKK